MDTKMLSEADAAAIPDAGDIAWFLDIDGTLLELAATPDGVRFDPDLATLLRRLQQISGSAVALVSGRSTSAVDALFAPLRLPVAGQHGAERRGLMGVRHDQAGDGTSLDAARATLAAWIAPRTGLLLEDKGLSLALHYRQAPEFAAEARRFLEDMVANGSGDLCLQPGKMVLELKATDRDKGIAIREFLDEAPFRGRFPVFVGDDASDEAGFQMVNGLGGLSIKVGSGATVARRRLPDVAAVHAWLAEMAGSAP